MSEYDLDILQLAGKGYCCSQVIVKMGLDLQGVENPGLVRSAAGLCRGIAGAFTCGALTGAACLLACYAGKGHDADEEDERLPLMLSQLSEWFSSYCKERFAGTGCRDIVENGEINPAICGDLVSRCYSQAMTILVENGFDPETSYDE